MRVSTCIAFVLPISLGSPAIAAGGSGCMLVDFEGVGDVAAVGTIHGPVDVTFGPSWLGLVDSDAGGSGHFANEPSPDTIAFFATPVPDPIDFAVPVRSVDIRYSASPLSLPFVLTAWDRLGGTGNVVHQVTGNTVGTASGGAACSGDPDGDHCLWDALTLAAGANAIRSITVSGAQSVDLAIDDLLICWDPAITTYCFGTSCPCGNDDASAGCSSSAGSGALLLALGSTSVTDDDLVLTASGIPPNQVGLFFMGGAIQDLAFGDGLRCVGGQIFRYLPPRPAIAGVLDLGPGIVQRSQSFGSAGQIAAGSTWSFQAWYRDSMGSPCGTNFNLSNGLGATFGI